MDRRQRGHIDLREGGEGRKGLPLSLQAASIICIIMMAGGVFSALVLPDLTRERSGDDGINDRTPLSTFLTLTFPGLEMNRTVYRNLNTGRAFGLLMDEAADTKLEEQVASGSRGLLEFVLGEEHPFRLTAIPGSGYPQGEGTTIVESDEEPSGAPSETYEETCAIGFKGARELSMMFRLEVWEVI